MGDITNINDYIHKKDLEIILEVNKKAVSIQTAVAEQNEEIISSLDSAKEKEKNIEDKIDKLIDKTDDISKDLFKIQVLFITGLLSLIVQIIQIFLKK
jgi:hypothetical protein